ncbi:hypothetical protein OESDEN_04180 [Oesophagostomum dentatum]|uniref:Uncharacterized protein n=1 Tax=Oesophagostomum dentatum TaxID=61180 RepID=A0A0B1TKB5_OESDE|nr:hypothetical protein OESDEN_04180 [Oesophagostomum dentatum]
MDADEKMKMLNKEQEKVINQMKQHQQEMEQEMKVLREEVSGHRSSQQDSDSIVEKMKVDVQKKDEAISLMEAEINEKKNLLVDKEHQLEEKEAKINALEEKLKTSATQHEEEMKRLQEEMSSNVEAQEEEEKAETSCMEIQTDPVKPPSPVQIVDLAREKELKSRIAELEHALEMKNDLIEKLHEQIPDKSAEDISMKKKDRSEPTGTQRYRSIRT